MILLVVYACFPGDSEGNKSARNAGVKVKSLSWVRLFATPWTVTYQATRTMSKNAGLGCHFLLQWIFLTQGSNPGLLHCRQTLYHLSQQGSLQCRRPQCRRPGFNPWVGKIPWSRERLTHSSILAWKIPWTWTEEPGALQSMGSQRVGHD